MPTALPIRNAARAEDRDNETGDWIFVFGNVAVIVVLLSGMIGAVWADPSILSGIDYSALVGP